jgi:hypothetical protein
MTSRQVSSPPSPVAPEASVPERASAPKEPERPRTAQELQPWLESRHLLHVRRVPLPVIEPFLPERLPGTMGLYALAHLPVTAPVDGSLNVSRRIRGAVMQAQLEAAAWAWLDAEAERVRRGLAREQECAASPRPPPTDARLIPWREALERARARARESAVPRWLPARPAIAFHERPPRLYVEEPASSDVRTSGSSRGGALKVRVVVDPLAVLDDQDGLTCWCTPRGPARCIHALSALDALLDMLSDPREAGRNSRLAELLFVVPGREILAAFGKAAARAHAQDAAAKASGITFRLEGLEDRQPRLRPYLSKGIPVSWKEREEARAALSDSHELEAFELCELLARLSVPLDGYALLLRALRLLAHSPHLFVGTRLDVPLQVREAPLGFAFGESEHGLTVRPAIDGVPFRPGALLPPASGSKEPLPWLLFEQELPRLTLVSVPSGAHKVLATLQEYGGRLPGSVRPVLLGTLAELEATYPVSLPESLEARTVPSQPGVLLRLRAEGQERLEGTFLVQPLREAPPLPVGEGTVEVRGLREGERVVARRELEAERTEAIALRERLGLPADPPARFTLEGAAGVTGFLARLKRLTGPSLRVEWEGGGGGGLEGLL